MSIRSALAIARQRLAEKREGFHGEQCGGRPQKITVQCHCGATAAGYTDGALDAEVHLMKSRAEDRHKLGNHHRSTQPVRRGQK